MDTAPPEQGHILLVEDSVADQIAVRKALRHSAFRSVLRVVDDGAQALDYLRRHGPFADADAAPRPDLVLMDLNMPRVDGRELLAQVKRDPALRDIPVVVWSTSAREEDIAHCYALGGNSFVTKPVDAAAFRRAVLHIEEFWLHVARGQALWRPAR